MRLEEDEENYKAKPQKLVNVLGKDRGIQAYVDSGDGVISVMSNAGGRACEVTDSMHMEMNHTGNRKEMA